MYLSQKPVPHQVGTLEDGTPQILEFFPISTRLASQMRALAVPIAQGLAVLFASDEKDQAQRVKQSGTEYEQTILALDPVLAKERAEQRKAAIGMLCEGILSQQSLNCFAEIIMDSLRNDYPRGKRTPDDVKKFLDDVPLPLMTPLLVGVAKANKDLFGPFAGWVSGERIKELLKKVAAGETSAAGSPAEKGEEATTAPPG